MKKRAGIIYIAASFLLCIAAVFLMISYPAAEAEGMGDETDKGQAVAEAGKGSGDTDKNVEAAKALAADTSENIAGDDEINDDITEKAEDSQGRIDEMTQDELLSIRQSYERIVVIDPGHGGDDQGIQASIDADDAEGNTSIAEKLSEKDVAFDISVRVKELLENEGVYVLLTRSKDESADDSSRILAANMLPADLFVSVHASQSDDSSVYGIGGYYNKDLYTPEVTGQEFASVLLNEISDTTGQRVAFLSDDIRKEPIRDLMIPSAVVSVGEMTNMQDLRLLSRDDYRQKCAQGIASGIIRTFMNIESERN